MKFLKCDPVYENRLIIEPTRGVWSSKTKKETTLEEAASFF